MRTLFELGDGLALAVAASPAAEGELDPGAVTPYPTSGLQKGLLLLDGGQELSSEGVGFGVPVLKRGPRAVFPGSAEIVVHPGTPHAITMAYAMDRVERLGGRRHRTSSCTGRSTRRARRSRCSTGALPLLRRPLLAASNGIRWLLRVRTRFEQIDPGRRRARHLHRRRPPGDVGVQRRPRPPAGGRHRGRPDERARRRRLRPLRRQRRRRPARRGHRRLEPGPRRDRVVRRRQRAASRSPSSSDPDPDVPGVRLYRGREVAGAGSRGPGSATPCGPGPPAFTYTLRIARDEERP